jgi:hypothetical protein
VAVKVKGKKSLVIKQRAECEPTDLVMRPANSKEIKKEAVKRIKSRKRQSGFFAPRK